MPENEQQDRTLSEIVVKEAVGKGLDSPMRDSILEAVEEADGSRGGRRLPLVGAVFGLGAALGFLVGQQSGTLDETALEGLDEPEIIEDVTERVEEETASMADADTETETETDAEADAESSPSRLPRVLLALGVLAGAVFLRRQLSGNDEEEWEPIEEFEPATSGESDEESEDEAEAEDDEFDEAEETEEE